MKQVSVNRKKIAVGIATAGRRDVLSEAVAFLANQVRQPDELLICPARPTDADASALKELFPSLQIVEGTIGSSHQRNALIAASEADVIVFFDDDFLPAPDYLQEVEELFLSHPEIVVATGDVLVDGILGPGLSYQEGVDILNAQKNRQTDASISPTFNGYGCNFAVVLSCVRAHGIRFDENLPLYAWLEDVDFSRQLAPFGSIVKATALRGVHLGTKSSGRSPGKRLGYSQVANRIYIMRKGNMSWSQAWCGNFNNIAANLTGSFRPEPWVDRRGRLKGNCLALWDLFMGCVDPQRILEM